MQSIQGSVRCCGRLCSQQEVFSEGCKQLSSALCEALLWCLPSPGLHDCTQHCCDSLVQKISEAQL